MVVYWDLRHTKLSIKTPLSTWSLSKPTPSNRIRHTLNITKQRHSLLADTRHFTIQVQVNRPSFSSDDKQHQDYNWYSYKDIWHVYHKDIDWYSYKDIARSATRIFEQTSSSQHQQLLSSWKSMTIYLKVHLTTELWIWVITHGNHYHPSWTTLHKHYYI